MTAAQFPRARIHAPVFDLVTSLATTDISEERVTLERNDSWLMGDGINLGIERSRNTTRICSQRVQPTFPLSSSCSLFQDGMIMAEKRAR